MKPRVLIFGENNAISSIHKKILDECRFDVLNFSDRGVCPLFHSGNHIRISDSVCRLLISFQNPIIYWFVVWMKKAK